VGQWPLIGRAVERELIGKALAGRTPGAGVLVAGVSGVGKTRLAQEAVAGLGRRAVLNLVGTVAAAGIPLAPVLAVFPDITASPDRGIAEARTRLAGQRVRPVIVVDDAHWLDPATQTLLHLLVRADEVRAVLTVRGDLPIPPTISNLWKDGHLARIDLKPLPAAESAQFVAAMVGWPVAAAVAADLHIRSQGLPLALRELVTEATASRALAVTDGVARAVRPLPPSRRLQAVVASNLDGLGQGGRRVLSVVALAEPVPLQLLLRVVDELDLNEAEREGLVLMSKSRLGQLDSFVVTAGHSLYAEVALAALTPLGRRQLLERLVGAIPGLVGSSEAMALRVAAWSLEIGRPVPTDDLLRAARLSHEALDPEQAERFARELWRQRRDFDTGLLYATTLARQQRYEPALDVLRAVPDQPLSEDQRVTRASMANEILARLGRHDQAIDELRQATAAVRSRRAKAHLVARAAFTTNLAGRTRTGLEMIDPLLRSDDLEERREAQAYAVVMLALDGRADEALALADHVERESHTTPDGDGDRLAPPSQMAAVQRGYALMYSGRFAPARHVAANGLRMAEEHGSRYLLAVWLNLLARIDLERGDAASAILPLGRLVAEAPDVSGGAQRALALSALVEAHALLAQVEQGREALAALEENPGNVPWHPAGSAQLATALLAFAEGDPAKAMDLFMDSYHRAAPANASIALTAAHAVARYGSRRAGLDLARDLPAVQGPLAPLRLAHMAALVTGDIDALLGVAEQFVPLGADLLAAEAYAAAATLATRRGNAREAARATGAGRPIALRLAGIRTPDLLPLTHEVATALTRREREIAMLAATGTTSQAIAAALVLSVRTVDNHLQRVYRKLGVRDRHSLRRAMGADGTGAAY